MEKFKLNQIQLNDNTRYLLNLLLTKWKQIAVSCFLITVLSIALALLLPKEYRASAKILPPDSGGGGLLSMLGNMQGLEGMAGNALNLLGGGGSNPEVYIHILRSRTISEKMIKKFNLIDYFELDSDSPELNMEDAYELILKIVYFEATLNQFLVIEVQTKDPQLSADMVNAYIEELDAFNRRVDLARARDKRVFIENRLSQAREDLQAAEDSLNAFQKRNQTVSLPDEMQAMITTAAQLKAQLVLAEVQLNFLENYSQGNASEISGIKSQIAELERQLARLKYGDDVQKPSDLFSIPFTELPDVGLELLRLKRNLEIQQEIYLLLLQQYELARIEEFNDTPTIRVLDYAVPPVKKTWPPRRFIVIGSFLTGIIISVGYFILKDVYKQLKPQIRTNA